MPGLLRGVARTAAVAGTATAVSNRVSRRQANRWAQQGSGAPAYMAETQPQYEQPQYEQQQYAPPPPPPAAPVADPIEQLKELAALREQGVLTDEEFAVQKSKILNRT
jgi:hypothetical protein